MTTATKKSNSPVKSLEYPVQAGKINIGIWENTIGDGGDDRTVYAVSFSRSYHDGKRWRDSKSMRTQDIPVLMHGLQVAYGWILEQSKA